MELDFTPSIQEKISIDQVNRLRNLQRQVAPRVSGAQNDRITQEKRLREVSEEFESLLINQMVDAMRKTLSKDRLYGGGLSEDIFQGMLDDEYSKIMAQNENFGLAEKVYEQLSRFI